MFSGRPAALANGQARAIVGELDVSEKPLLIELDLEISAVAKAFGA